MDQDAYDDLLQRLTALVIKLDERDDDFVARLEHHDAVLARLDATIAEMKVMNREQVVINQRLETLLERAWRSSPNGHTD